MTSERSTPTLWPETELRSTPSVEASPARTLARLVRELALRVSGQVFGASMPVSLANYDPASSSWKTSQHCFLEGWEPFSETWPRSGMMRSGKAFPLQPLAPLTDANASGLWPTPVQPNGGRTLHHVDEWRGASAYHNGKKVQVDLAQAVKLWPTPQARDHFPAHKPEYIAAKKAQGHGMSNLNDAIGGPLNPTWVEWLMGYPIGWSALAPSVTPSSRKSRKHSPAQS
jgi:hypothetical protein